MARQHKAVREVIDYARSFGFTLRGGLTGSGHWRLVHRSGRQVIIPATPSGKRWKKNSEALIRRMDREAGNNGNE
jgi:hypothetical protein